MKIAINRKIRHIHWSAVLAAVIFLLISAHVYKEYRAEKFLIEQGIVSPAIVVKKWSCSGRNNYVKVNVQTQNRVADLRINYVTCNKTHVGDTITVYCSDDLDRIITYDPGMGKPRGWGLYISIAGFLMGISFLIFKNSEKK